MRKGIKKGEERRERERERERERKKIEMENRKKAQRMEGKSQRTVGVFLTRIL